MISFTLMFCSSCLLTDICFTQIMLFYSPSNKVNRHCLELHGMGELTLLEGESGRQVGSKERSLLDRFKDSLVNSLLISNLGFRNSSLLLLMNAYISVTHILSYHIVYIDLYLFTFKEFLLLLVTLLGKVSIVDLVINLNMHGSIHDSYSHKYVCDTIP